MTPFASTTAFGLVNLQPSKSRRSGSNSASAKILTKVESILGITIAAAVLAVSIVVGWSFLSETVTTIFSSNPFEAARLISGMP